MIHLKHQHYLLLRKYVSGLLCFCAWDAVFSLPNFDFPASSTYLMFRLCQYGCTSGTSFRIRNEADGTPLYSLRSPYHSDYLIMICSMRSDCHIGLNASCHSNHSPLSFCPAAYLYFHNQNAESKALRLWNSDNRHLTHPVPHHERQCIRTLIQHFSPRLNNQYLSSRTTRSDGKAQS